MNHIKRATEVLKIEIEGIEQVMNSLDERFNQAIEAILKTVANDGKVIIAGVGKNWHIANKLSATFTSTGTPAVALHPIEAMHGDFGILGKRDILLAMSYSGASDELLALLPPVKRKGVPIIAITGEEDSPLAQHADIVILAKIGKEACPFNLAPTTSTTATLALGDAMAMTLLEAHGFKIEDYATMHPGGAIGRTLLLHVSDIMRTDDRCATVQQGSLIRDSLIAMTKAQAGCVAILDDNKKLVGVMTDGDLRRHLLETPNLLEDAIDTIMTSEPLTLCPDMLAVEVLNIYEKHNIDDLVVVDKDNTFVGVVDIQDMPKLKVL